MNVWCVKRWLVVLASGLGFGLSSASFAAVNLELRLAPDTPATVVNGSPVNVEVYAVNAGAGNQNVGLIQMVFTWENSALKLLGATENGPYNWDFLGFVNDSAGDGLNAPYAPGPGNDGNAMLTAAAPIVGAPASVPPAPGMLVGTLNFLAIDTFISADVTSEQMIQNTMTFIKDARVGGVDVTGDVTFTVTVTIICNGNPDCNDSNDCTNDTCTAQDCSHTFTGAGTGCGSAANTDCDNPDTCNGAGVCLPNYEATGFNCGSGANTACDNPDTCNGTGTCLPNYEAPGFNCGSAANTECDNPDSCNGSGTCLSNFEPSGTACGSAVDTDCNNPDTCNGSGTCQTNLEPAGTMCGSPTNDACTDPDTCNASGTCLSNNFVCPPTTPFCIDVEGDGVPDCVECTSENHCNDGMICTSDFCSLDHLCLHADEADGTPCTSDGQYCTGVEACMNGVCTSPGIPCNDQNVCTDDSCNEGNDTCVYTPDNNNNPDDGSWCNGTDTCVNGQIVVGQPPICADGNPCTNDDCNDNIDMCVHVNNAASCEDGDACTMGDECSGGVCQPGSRPVGANKVDLLWTPSAPAVPIGDPFSLQLRAVSVTPPNDEMFVIDVVLNWDETKVEYLGFTDNSPYDWLVAFHPNDESQDGLNYPFDPGMPPDNDGDAWVSFWSQLEAPAVATASPGLLIATFNFQTLNPTASTILSIPDCVGMAPTLSKIEGGAAGYIQRILGSANIQIAECFTSPQCNDGLFCSGVDLCVQGQCVHPGSPCNDNNPCTDNICTEANDTCTYVVDNTNNPDDGLFCNGVNTCLNGQVVTGAPPNCNDNNVCTTDSCSEALRDCVNDPNGNACNDSDPCTNQDLCMNGVCSGIEIPNCVPCDNDNDCNDGVACTIDDCDSVLDYCTIAAYDDAFCQDGVFCNGYEVCNPQIGNPNTGCADSPPPCVPCDEQNGCTCDPPILEAVGGKYLKITPPVTEYPTPMAFVVSYCGGSISKYVGARTEYPSVVLWDINGDNIFDGTYAYLVDDPDDALFLTADRWAGVPGGAVYVTGRDIIPEREHEVQGDCGVPGLGTPNLTAAVMDTTWVWGDMANILQPGQAPSFLHINAMVKGFQNQYQTIIGPTIKPSLDIRGSAAGNACIPQQSINFLDINWEVKAFQNVSYLTLCPGDPCAP